LTCRRRPVLYNPCMDLATTKAVLTLLEAGERFALVSTLETAGSSPRHSGAAMLVKTDGSILGTIGGGALEARAIRSALDVLDAGSSRLMDYELTNADSAGLGMICGGRGILLIEHVDPTAGANRELYVTLLDLLTAGRTGWLVTGASVAPDDGVTVKRCLVDSTGAITGESACSVDALQGLARMGGALDGHTAGDRPNIYVQPVGAPGTAYVFGAGHCGRSLVPLLSMVGFRTVIVDDRADFANRDRFPDADSFVVPDSFENALEELDIDRQSYLVIMTRGHMLDRALLAQALRTEAGYIGMIGSKKKVSETFQALRDAGFTEEDLGRVHAPIGMSIGAETPEEIAVSIAGEIIQTRRGRKA
jgi:xanthine dehydrogenase accessory factor